MNNLTLITVLVRIVIMVELPVSLTFGLCIVLGIGGAIIQLSVYGNPPPQPNAIATVSQFMFLFPVYLRLQNIGWNPWLCLVLLIGIPLGLLGPLGGILSTIVGLFIGIPCMSFQEGYADSSGLDTTGKVLLGIFFGSIALVFVMACLLGAAGAAASR